MNQPSKPLSDKEFDKIAEVTPDDIEKLLQSIADIPKPKPKR